MMRRIAPVVLALLAACSQPSGNENDFAFAAAVDPQANAMVHRIDLPAAALAAIKRDDLGDVRLLDARGKELPLARLDLPGVTALTRHAVPLYPIAGGQGSESAGAVLLAVARPGQTILIESNAAATMTGMAAALLDSRALNEPAVGLQLELELPAQTPISITVEASRDLKTWDMLAEKVLFSPTAGVAPLGGARLALPGSDLEQRYLRLRWTAEAGVNLRGATVDTAKSVPAPAIALATRGAVLDDAHNLRLAVSTPIPLVGIELVGTKADGLIPVRLYGRDAQEQAWQPLAAATLRGDGRAARFDLPGSVFRQYKVEADKRSAGFSRPPEIKLLLQPMPLLTVFNGQPPYRLTAGNSQALAKYFAPADLAEPKLLQTDLPIARISTSAAPVIDLGAGPGDSPLAPRKLALWAALLLGTAVLAWGAVRLLRAGPDSDQSAS